MFAQKAHWRIKTSIAKKPATRLHQTVSVWCLMIILLVSQSLAFAAVSCPAMQNTTHSAHKMEMKMDHLHHSAMQHAVPQQMPDDCCGDDCQCPAGITSFIALTSSQSAKAAPSLEMALQPYPFVVIEALPPALIKPPIFA